MLQPDFGSGMVIVATGFVMLFICGVPIRYFMYFILTGVAGIVALIISAPYRLELQLILIHGVIQEDQDFKLFNHFMLSLQGDYSE